MLLWEKERLGPQLEMAAETPAEAPGKAAEVHLRVNLIQQGRGQQELLLGKSALHTLKHSASL